MTWQAIVIGIGSAIVLSGVSIFLAEWLIHDSRTGLTVMINLVPVSLIAGLAAGIGATLRMQRLCVAGVVLYGAALCAGFVYAKVNSPARSQWKGRIQ